MAQDHTLMASRREFKYLIPETVALQVRSFVQQHLELDEFGIGRENLSYEVHSLYLDSDQWEIHHRTVNGDKNRFKLRVRYYNESPGTPVFFEIKRRMKDVILKQRGAVRREAAARILSGFLPDPGDLTTDAIEDRVAIERFLVLMHHLRAKPKIHVAYDREAYVNSFDNEVRVTLDRNVRGCSRPGGELLTHMPDPYVATTDMVILELKFTGRFPVWYRDLVQCFDCFQSGAAKYVETALLHHGRTQGIPHQEIIRNLMW